MAYYYRAEHAAINGQKHLVVASLGTLVAAKGLMIQTAAHFRSGRRPSMFRRIALSARI
jgi:hypothetical protein